MQKHEDTDQTNSLEPFDLGLHLFTFSVVYCLQIKHFELLTLKAPRKNTSENVIC